MRQGSETDPVRDTPVPGGAQPAAGGRDASAAASHIAQPPGNRPRESYGRHPGRGHTPELKDDGARCPSGGEELLTAFPAQCDRTAENPPPAPGRALPENQPDRPGEGAAPGKDYVRRRQALLSHLASRHGLTGYDPFPPGTGPARPRDGRGNVLTPRNDLPRLLALHDRAGTHGPSSHQHDSPAGQEHRGKYISPDDWLLPRPGTIRTPPSGNPA